MKVAIVNPHFYLANVPNEFPLAKGLSELGVETQIITSNSIGKRAKFIPKKFIEKGFREEKKFGFKIKRLNCLFDWRGENPFIPGLRKELEKEEFDLIQSTDYYRFITLQSCKVAKKSNKPFIFTSHRYLPPTDFLSKKILQFFSPIFQKEVLNKTDHLIAVSKDSKKYVLNQFSFPQDKISVISQGLDHDLFFPKKKPDTNKILSIGKLIPLKGHRFLIEACRILKEQGLDFSLTIKGRGPELENLQRLIKKNQLEKNISIDTSFSWHTDLPKTLNLYDIFVLPSTIETIGLSLLEAMSCGLAVVGTKIGGLNEAIEDKKNGLLVNHSNATELANNIGILLEDKKLREKLGKNARNTILENFSYKKKAQQHLQIFKSLI